MMKRNLLKIVLIMGLLGILGFGMASAQSKPISLSFWHIYTYEPQRSTIDYFIHQFESKHPNIKIKVNAVENDPYKTAIKVAMGSGASIFFTWAGEYTGKFVRAKQVLDLTSYFDKNSLAGLLPAAKYPYTFEGRLYGLPLYVDTKYFFYNKKIFNKLGLTVPKTWDEFIAVCKKLKADGVIPIAFGNRDKWGACHYITIMNQKIVGEKKLQEAYATSGGDFSDPGFVDALKRLKYLNDEGYFSPQPNAIGEEEVRPLFYSGKAAMIYDWLKFTTKNAAAFSLDYGFFKFPDIPKGKGNQNFIIGAPSGLAISKDSKYPKEAAQFLKFLITKENGAYWVSKIGNTSSVLGAVTEKNAYPDLLTDSSIIQSATGMVGWLDTVVEVSIASVYLNGIQAILLGEKTPEQVMKEVADQAQRVKEQLKK